MDMDDRPAVYKLDSEPPDMTRNKLTQEKTESSEEPSSGWVGMVCMRAASDTSSGNLFPFKGVCQTRTTST